MEVAVLEQTLRDHPRDLASWRAYGDWLREQGDVRHELIRLEQQRERTGPYRRQAVQAEIDALVQEHQKSWDAALPPGVTALTRRYGFATRVAVEWSDDAPASIERVLREPFVTGLLIEPDGEDEDYDEDYDEDGRPVFRPSMSAGALAVLDLGRLVELDLSYLPLGEPGALSLAVSTTIGRIETLDLRYCHIGDIGLGALAAAGHFADVRRLRLQFNALTAEGVRALHGFKRLTDLDLRYNSIGEEGVDALLAAPFVGGLSRLLLYAADVSKAGVQKLAQAPQLPPALRSYWRSV